MKVSTNKKTKNQEYNSKYLPFEAFFNRKIVPQKFAFKINVVYFDQLLGAAGTQKLIEILFYKHWHIINF